MIQFLIITHEIDKETETWSIKVTQEVRNYHVCFQILNLEKSSKPYYQHVWRTGIRVLNNMVRVKIYIQIDESQGRYRTKNTHQILK